MEKNKPLHILYVGRLEREKGIDIVLECIERGVQEDYNIDWHICGEGSQQGRLEQLSKNYPNVHLYGHVDGARLQSLYPQMDVLFMPSRFLETFGMVALESLMAGLVVIGFRQGGLTEFVPQDLALDPADPVGSFFRILSRPISSPLDVSAFARPAWQSQLSDIVEGDQDILIVHDYCAIIGGAEIYVHALMGALQDMGKSVVLFGYQGRPSRLQRIILMIVSQIAFWRYFSLKKIIHKTPVDLIWLQSVMRYIGPWGVASLSSSGIREIMMHHDLSLVAPYPSRIYTEGDIPRTRALIDWYHGMPWYLWINITAKWISVRIMWHLLRDVGEHLVPSAWMIPYIARYTDRPVRVFAHTDLK